MGGSGRGPDPHAFLEALFWLEERLDGALPLPSDDLRKESEEDDIAFRTLRRAKAALQIRSIKRGKDSHGNESWDWQLPSITTISPPEWVSTPGLHGLHDPHSPHGPLGPLQKNQAQSALRADS